MSREDHVQAVEASTQMIEELQSMLGMARVKAEETMESVYGAIGNSLHASAHNAFVQTNSVLNGLPEMIGNLEAAKHEMRTYREAL